MSRQTGRAIQRNSPNYGQITVAKVYKDANKNRGKEWYDYENWELPKGDMSPYKILDWIGTGKYSDVFTAYNDKEEVVAIKVLKPVRQLKYTREAKILMNLREGPCIIKLHDIVQNPNTKQYSFIFEYIEEMEYKKMINSMDETDVKLYLFQLLKALDFAHSRGIMHRDVKPLNILFDINTKKLRLIDWGLADFYHPKTNYNIHVASRHYKPPELLLDYQFYDYSVDIWSFGVTMAGFIFKQTPFFRGIDDFDMVQKIVNVLGGDILNNYLEKYEIPLPENISKSILKTPAKDWEDFKTSATPLATPLALDLIRKCVVFDHMDRITAAEALNHPYFDSVRDIKVE